MLSNDHLYEELEKLDNLIKDDEDLATSEKAFIKSQTLIIKLLHNIRSNTFSMMKHMGLDTKKD